MSTKPLHLPLPLLLPPLWLLLPPLPLLHLLRLSSPGAGDPVNAPMPGTILKVNVTANQTVKAGTVLCVLEAMKMENEIMAPKDGTVTQVLVSNGSKVDTGAPLVVLA